MFCIIGLGNPGKKYHQTRHNAGALFIEHIRIAFSMPNLRLHNRTAARIRTSKNILLAVPETMMNNSGTTVASVLSYFQIAPKQFLLVHDDKDLPLGTEKIQYNRTSAGHNGVQSVIDALGTKEFLRLRIGIGPVPEHIPTETFVLHTFSEKELAKLQKTVFPRAIHAVQNLYREGGTR